MQRRERLICKHCHQLRVSISIDLLKRADPAVMRLWDKRACKARYEGRPHEFVKRAVRY